MPTLMEPEELDPGLFLELPWLVVREILSYVPREYISDAFLKVPWLRERLIEEYYGELHFILTPLKRPHSCYYDRSELIDISSYGEISSFLDENPDIVPHTVRVMTSMDFISMRSLLTDYRDRFERIPNLHLEIMGHHFTEDCFEFIQSFGNLKKLQLTGPVLDDISDMSTTFAQLNSLETLVILGHKIRDWSGVALPKSLKHLDISWMNRCNVTTIDIPPNVEEIYWNDAGLTSSRLSAVDFPSCISTLVITEGKIECLKLSQLPRSLKCLEISRSQLRDFSCDEVSDQWPLSLETLILSRNRIHNGSLDQLSETRLPPGLQILKLDGNLISHVYHLRHLPDSLKLLDISKNPLQNLEDPTNYDGYLYYRFPRDLEILNLSECIHAGPARYGTSLVLPSERIRLPSTLQELDLSGNLNYRFEAFLLPESLRRLSMICSGIRSLSKYDFTFEDGLPNTEVPVAWADLKNLVSLDVSANVISTLDGWTPPPNLVLLDLASNRLKEISSNSSLFNKKINLRFQHLQRLNLSNNEIESIDDLAHFPPNVVFVNLEKNNLTQFIFTDGMLNSKMLCSLNLAGNGIEHIGAKTAKKATLREFDLSLAGRDRPARLIHPDSLYEVLDNLGLKTTRRKRNTRSMHQFL
ncbi:hypothetical protein C7M61_001644 [Candidozyma pseudohaemuli]|uniref:Uncharacterized protein n=1 Tax=Candidozyma pseudohaemuli TaxID=418784 RepID=A0A2P7YV44_9ASCO|nr:hypothetical protein C7M61_001644 [[Candida] pseudohaemulonii]PSK39835.1 hypothetical protein C7M61_001644 [[Candida] pseudohaemulonii]